MKKNLILIALFATFIISCTNQEKKLFTDKKVEAALSEIKQNEDFEKIDYEFFFIPSHGEMESAPNNILKINVSIKKPIQGDKKSLAKKIAKKIYNASKNAKNSGILHIEYTSTKESLLVHLKAKKSFVFNTSEF